MTPIRVLIADDHAILRAGLRLMLDSQSDMTVVGEAADGVEVSRRVRELKPDVVILDISMPGPRAGHVVRKVRRSYPATRVLILSMHDDSAYVQSALSAGAAGYVVKRAADSELISAIRAVHAGRTVVDLTQPVDRERRSRSSGDESSLPKNLSRQERVVLRLLAEGHSNKQIADKIRLSVKTVETYRKRISDKLELKGRAQLYRFASESGILDTEPTARSKRR